MFMLNITIKLVYYTSYGLYKLITSASSILPRMLAGAAKAAFKI